MIASRTVPTLCLPGMKLTSRLLSKDTTWTVPNAIMKHRTATSQPLQVDHAEICYVSEPSWLRTYSVHWTKLQNREISSRQKSNVPQ